MAESNRSDNNSTENRELECPICLQPCVYPAELPCGHVFCFLCIKGIANQSKKCALCRKEIPKDYLECPKIIKNQLEESSEYKWYYEGRNGWWQYDDRTCKELESCYKSGERTCELLIAGFLYVTDLEAMLQMRRNDPTRTRRIKRDLATVAKKGVAGLRIENNVDVEKRDILRIPQVVANEEESISENSLGTRNTFQPNSLYHQHNSLDDLNLVSRHTRSRDELN